MSGLRIQNQILFYMALYLYYNPIARAYTAASPVKRSLASIISLTVTVTA